MPPWWRRGPLLLLLLLGLLDSASAATATMPVRHKHHTLFLLCRRAAAASTAAAGRTTIPHTQPAFLPAGGGGPVLPLRRVSWVAVAPGVRSDVRTFAAGGGAKRGASSDSSSSGGGSGSDGGGNGGGGGGGVRINKCFAAFASRREADKYVAAGRVCVNGQVAEPGIRVQAGDRVTLDGKPVEWERHVFPDSTAERGLEGSDGGAAGRVYIKYWKPRGVICTTDESVRGNIVSAIEFPGGQRIFPVGRLDKESTGLILLTNDGRVPNAVLRSSLNHRKTYKVRLNRPIHDDDLAQLRSGVTITTPVQRDRVDRLITAKTLPCEVTRLGARVFEIVLREGRNRQIRRMAEALGYRVLDLHREKVMDIDLRGLRGEGEWRRLDEGEMGMILEALKVFEAAERGGGGVDPGREEEEDDEE